MKLFSVILLSGLLVLATTAFSQDTNAPVPEKGKPALSEVQGHGFGSPALQRGGPQGGPRGPMWAQGRGQQGKGCCCPCHEKHGKKYGKQQRHGRK